ncbi:hypothetical protein GCM10025868_08040 [Angustibacter aerolatus]|uniref:Uncharacterized protein n=1 Tax=Angustibacter aerolatus TaxID=1162965 RepID=A0ABQ6JDQ8_9ACTN|nr:hypothetical protein GCM10025868_08040 [Angustibacter aerolatus]
MACVVIEPVQGEGGFVVPADGFLPAIAAWCTANGVVFVADEIQTGFGRTGAMFACEHEGVVPDLITTAKGIAGVCRSPPSPGAPSDGRRARRRPRRHLRRQPDRLRRGARRHRVARGRRPARPGRPARRA